MSRPAGAVAPHAFAGSLSLTVHGVLIPILRSGALAGAAICAAAALIAPWLTRPSSPAVRVVLLTGWVAASVSALHAVIAASADRGMAATLHHVVPVAVLAAVAVLAPSLYADRRRTAGASKAPGAAAELP